jgi:copper chaperone NosL
MSSIRRFVPALLVVVLAACAQQASTSGPVDPRADTHCELDGMTLADYPGPKGQIHYVDGKTAYFCDTLELLSMLLHPEQVRAIAGAYTQDMARADWEHPQGNWIDATKAVYVRGARRNGSMGPTLASFAERADAQAFAHQFGGEVLSYAEIKPEMVRLDGAAGGDMGM